MDKLYLLVKEQFPEFVRSDYPKFVQFVQAYYKWLEENSPKDLKHIIDIDQTPAEYFNYFAKQLDVYGLLNATNPYIKKYITNIKEIYTSKGTEQGLLFLLRAVYDSDVTIDHPIEYVLKPSDGKWVQERFITLRTFFGSLDSISEWDFSYDCRCAGRNQVIDVTRVEVLNGETIRLYYQNQVSTVLFIGQRVNIFNSFGAVMFTGTIVPSPSTIEVVSSGTNWQIGQVIVWPGSDKNTVIRVADVTEGGGIKRIEVVDYGYEHSNNETLIVSPYPFKPLSVNLALTQDQISFDDPPAFQYTLDIVDGIDGVVDNVAGYAAGLKFNPFFLEDYQQEVYVGDLVFNNNTFTPPILLGQSNLSLEDWITSRATLRYIFDTIGVLRGVWADESGHISTDTIRIQDSFYFQQFSYVIESDINPNVYKDLAAAVHLAGSKAFTKYNATSVFKLDTKVAVTFPFITLDIIDITGTSDNNNAEFIKLRLDDPIVLDTPKKTFNKNVKFDGVAVSELIIKVPNKISNDNLTTVDTDTFNLDKYLKDDTLVADTPIKSLSKVAVSSVVADSPDTSLKSVDDYFEQSEEYSLQLYAINQTVLNIPE